MTRLQRLKRLRRDPRRPLLLVAIFGIGAYLLFILRLIWG